MSAPLLNIPEVRQVTTYNCISMHKVHSLCSISSIYLQLLAALNTFYFVLLRLIVFLDPCTVVISVRRRLRVRILV